MSLTEKYIWGPISGYLQQKVEEAERGGSEFIEYDSIENALEK